ncbi:HAD family hydrolase [Parafrankia elaeagni]|uniref:HAD family hydrolase n=1 Tax=Parafrankia elaeagni TaxID=222534 RepID=UPI000399F7EB|nr:HAD family hydrolase [Parafrankia elaeagni]
MSVTVVSVDLWGTLISYGDRDAEAAWRVREFHLALTAFGHTLPAEHLDTTVRAVRAELLDEQRQHGRQIPVPEQVRTIVRRLGIDADDALVQVLTVAHTHAVLRACPQLIPGAHACLAALSAAGYRLVLASNTLATPGAVTRQILDRHRLTDHFDRLFFSSELGVAKPQAAMFHAIAEQTGTSIDQVVHVGNDWRTDVRGALDAGCRAVWFNPGHKPSRPEAPDAALLVDIPVLVQRLAPQTTPTAVPEASAADAGR